MAWQMLLQALLKDLTICYGSHIIIDIDLMHFVATAEGYGSFNAVTRLRQSVSLDRCDDLAL
jgi:hypothetical protein